MTLTDRLVGVLKLDAPAYEDIEHDPRANAQALTIVILASLAAGLGGGLERWAWRRWCARPSAPWRAG